MLMRRSLFRQSPARALLLGLGVLLFLHAGLPDGHVRWLPSQCVTVLTPAGTSGIDRGVGETPVNLLLIPTPSPPVCTGMQADLPTRQIAPLASGPGAVFVQMLVL